MLTTRLSEQLAELKDTKIKEITVCVAPKLIVTPWRLTVPSSFVVGTIAQVVTTKYSDTAHTLTPRQAHGYNSESSSILQIGTGVFTISLVPLLRTLNLIITRSDRESRITSSSAMCSFG